MHASEYQSFKSLYGSDRTGRVQRDAMLSIAQQVGGTDTIHSIKYDAMRDGFLVRLKLNPECPIWVETSDAIEDYV